MRERLSLTLFASLLAGAAFAGCAGPESEDVAESTPPQETGIPGGGGSPIAGCVPGEGNATIGGSDSTGATHPGEVGTGTGDIGSPVSCPT